MDFMSLFRTQLVMTLSAFLFNAIKISFSFSCLLLFLDKDTEGYSYNDEL